MDFHLNIVNNTSKYELNIFNNDKDISKCQSLMETMPGHDNTQFFSAETANLKDAV